MTSAVTAVSAVVGASTCWLSVRHGTSGLFATNGSTTGAGSSSGATGGRLTRAALARQEN
jgi:hypothetical protein